MMIFMILAEKNSLSANIMQPLSNNLGNVSLNCFTELLGAKWKC